MTVSLPGRDLLRVDEVCAYFGVCRQTVHNWIDEGKLQAVKMSKRMTRITKESVLRCQKEIEE